MEFAKLRRTYHAQLCQRIIRISTKRKAGQVLAYPNFADGDSASSVSIAHAIVEQISCALPSGKITGQKAGRLFEETTRDFLSAAFAQLAHLRPGEWRYSTENTAIDGFAQYEHLARLKEILQTNDELAVALGTDYLVTPDIVIARHPVTDQDINRHKELVDETVAGLSPLRAGEEQVPLLHASISCKWTIRSDRAQNTRTEALNLIRNRKGHTPHIVAVTAEPLPTRLAALALGTGDLDCVYHFALYELMQAVKAVNNADQQDMLNTLLAGKRLRDISDLPLDLAI